MSGYPPEDLLLSPEFIGECRKLIEELATEPWQTNVIVGAPWAENGRLFNSAVCFGPGIERSPHVVHKCELPNYGVFDEKRYFENGNEVGVLKIQGLPEIAVTICEDIWIRANNLRSSLAGDKVLFTINLSASPFHAGKRKERLNILKDFIEETGSALAYVNLIGGQDELVFDGGSIILDAAGDCVSESARFVEELLVADVDFEKSKDADGEIDSHLMEIEEIHRALVLGLRDYVRKNGFKKVVIGLSGGIDSAVVACLAVSALGKDAVTAVTMPSMFTSNDTLTDAGLIAKNLDIEFITIPIKKAYETLIDELSDSLGYSDGREPGIEAENLQARIRGNMLMALSNRHGLLVLTTGNKSETAVGYSTLYGDTAGGFAIIKDLPKIKVYELAAYINQCASTALIPLATIDRPPTAELRPDQKDEDSLPPYEILDPILAGYIENNFSAREIAETTGAPIDLVAEIIRKVDLSEYKRRQSPPGIKITPRAFGRDRRMPVTNRFRSK